MADYNGKSWFRANIAPYLGIIKEIVGGYPPTITTVTPNTFAVNVTTTISVVGNYFTPIGSITCATGTISNVNFIDQNTLTFDFVSSVAQTHAIVFTTNAGTSSTPLVTEAPIWVDLRLGSSSSFTELHGAGTTIIRDADGITTDGSNWSNWLMFDSASWDRSIPKRLSLICKTVPAPFMVGIVSTQNHNPTATAQYYESEIVLYAPSSTLWGFFGTNAAGNGVSSANTNVVLSSATYPNFKVQYNDNGQAGATVRIFGLTSLTDLNDETNLLATWTVGAVMSANDSPLLPFITGTSTSRLVAYRLEDM